MVTSIRDRLRHHQLNMLFRDIVVTQSRANAEITQEPFHKINRCNVRISRVRSHYIQPARNPHTTVQSGLAFRVKTHDLREA